MCIFIFLLSPVFYTSRERRMIKSTEASFGRRYIMQISLAFRDHRQTCTT